MKSWIGVTGAMALAVVTGCAAVPGAGRTVYDQNCAVCHGPGGHGDGDFAAQLLTLPPDLTVLARNNGGSFPEDRVRAVIEGPGRADHFSGAMPEFGETLPRLTGASQIDAVVHYLETIQAN
ncbi:c-type cytochrome [Shimia biformata]|uniref:c-type cytochrome n=1 Tax=Shimia biformata TaxID=1294299 RepID=UPI00194F7244